MLILTASFLATALSHSFPVIASTLFGVNPELVLFSAGACTRVAWVPFFSPRMIAEAGNITGAYPHLFEIAISKDAISTPRHPIAAWSIDRIRYYNTDSACPVLEP
jgi:hypothetical protein